MDNPTDFYNKLSTKYHLIYPDWEQAVKEQGEVLHGLISKNMGGNGKAFKLLDCACGIGTQVLGLARLGYKATGSDISGAAIRRAKKEASKRGLDIKYHVADFRDLPLVIHDRYDIIICCDNSLPHVLDDADLQRAVRSFHAILNPEGLLIVSTRDYDEILSRKPVSTPMRNYGFGGDERIIFQIWKWMEDKPIYELEHFILTRRGIGWKTHTQKANYRAYTRAELVQFFADGGFGEIKWLKPEETGYYQPIMLAKRR